MFSSAATKNQWEEVFFNANQAYRKGHYQKAADGYKKLILQGLASGDLYFNLGNAYFRMNQLGPAIVNFERARLLMPRDADLRFNLGYAKDQRVDATTESEGFVGMVFFWLGSFNLAELFWAFVIVNFLFWTILFIRLFNRHEWTYYTALMALVLWIVVGTSFGVQWYHKRKDDRAVIMPRAVDVLAGPDIGDTVLFRLHAGTIVGYERSEDGWSLIRLSDKKRGWVQASAVEKIVEEQEPLQKGVRKRIFHK